MKAGEGKPEKAESGADSNTPTQVLKSYIAGGKRSPEEILDEVKRLQLSRGLSEPQKVSTLLAAVIDTSADPKTIAKQYANNAALFKAFANSRINATTLLNCIEVKLSESVFNWKLNS